MAVIGLSEILEDLACKRKMRIKLTPVPFVLQRVPLGVHVH